MKSITFPEVTNKIAEHQEEFETVHVQYQLEEASVNMCFELNEEEKEQIAKTGKLWYKQFIPGGQMHPMRISPFKEEIIK